MSPMMASVAKTMSKMNQILCEQCPTSGTDMGKHIDKHGDAIKAIALEVDDAEYAYNATVSRGAKPFFEPITEGDSLKK